MEATVNRIENLDFDNASKNLQYMLDTSNSLLQVAVEYSDLYPEEMILSPYSTLTLEDEGSGHHSRAWEVLILLHLIGVVAVLVVRYVLPVDQQLMIKRWMNGQRIRKKAKIN